MSQFTNRNWLSLHLQPDRLIPVAGALPVLGESSLVSGARGGPLEKQEECAGSFPASRQAPFHMSKSVRPSRASIWTCGCCCSWPSSSVSAPGTKVRTRQTPLYITNLRLAADWSYYLSVSLYAVCWESLISLYWGWVFILNLSVRQGAR